MESNTLLNEAQRLVGFYQTEIQRMQDELIIAIQEFDELASITECIDCGLPISAEYGICDNCHTYHHRGSDY